MFGRTITWPEGEGGCKSDRLVEAVKAAKRLPGVNEILLPGERGWLKMAEGGTVEILPVHWESLTKIIDSVGLTVDGLRLEFEAG